jgi:hypothetical protein
MDFAENENQNSNIEMKNKDEIKSDAQMDDGAECPSEEVKLQENPSNSEQSENNDRDENSSGDDVGNKADSDKMKEDSESLSGEAEKGGKRKVTQTYSCGNCLGEFSKQKMVKCYTCKRLTCKQCESIETHMNKRNDHSSYICKDCFESKNDKNR